jgi:hypothetical protein
MIGVGHFEVVVGLLVAALIIYFTFRDRVSSVSLVLMVVLLSPLIGIFMAASIAYVLYALFGG